MEEVLHLSLLTNPESNKTDNKLEDEHMKSVGGSQPITPTDIRDVHF